MRHRLELIAHYASEAPVCPSLVSYSQSGTAALLAIESLVTSQRRLTACLGPAIFLVSPQWRFCRLHMAAAQACNILFLRGVSEDY